MDTTKEENPSIDNKVVAFKLLVFGYGLLLAGPLIGYVVRGGTSNTLPASHAFYLGASIMVFSQVWFLLVGEHRKPPEDEESKNTLMKYVAAPVLLGYAVLFLIPVLGFVPFAEAYRYAFAVFRNLLVPVLFFVGPIYAALFYVYKMA
jgi:hypothetical protein